MNEFEVTFPEIAFLGLTHLVLVAGLSLMAAERVGDRKKGRFGAI